MSTGFDDELLFDELNDILDIDMTDFGFDIDKIDLFKAYVAYVDEKKGLYRINAISEGINTSAYGIELKNLFNLSADAVGDFLNASK